jgi:bifunctional NMN adenylyltransferase/nudix hydrolase
MTNKQFNLLVFIGRFQPFHNGHLHVINQASELAEKVLVLVGSADCNPDARNPFTFYDRKDMIENSVDVSKVDVFVEALNDHPYQEETWLEEVQQIVSMYAGAAEKIGLIGHAKDHSSYYLKLFPNYESVNVNGVNANEGTLLDATEIRKLFFKKDFSPANDRKLLKLVPEGTYEVLNDYRESLMFDRICDELSYIDEYKKVWGFGPFVTVDAVVVQAGHVLLVERGDFPGKGQFALPGGFVEPRENLENAVMRELREETSIDVPPSVLKNRITHMQHFANPWRSNRAHIITFAFLFDLNNEIDRKAEGRSGEAIGMTKVKGGDDAANAFWFPIGQLSRDMMFEDHFDIIEVMLGKKAIGKL